MNCRQRTQSANLPEMRNGEVKIRPPHRDALLTQHLQTLLGDAAPLALSFLRQHLQWIELTGGEVLMEQGESGDSAYLCISGRLRVYVRADDSSHAWCARCHAAKYSAR